MQITLKLNYNWKPEPFQSYSALEAQRHTSTSWAWMPLVLNDPQKQHRKHISALYSNVGRCKGVLQVD